MRLIMNCISCLICKEIMPLNKILYLDSLICDCGEPFTIIVAEMDLIFWQGFGVYVSAGSAYPALVIFLMLSILE